MTRPHLEAAPQPEFWLGELRFEHFAEHLELLQRPMELRQRLNTEYVGPQRLRVLRRILAEEGNAPTVHLHLLMVAHCLQRKKPISVKAVAETHLPPEQLGPLLDPAGRIRKIAAAALLYQADPAHLVAIDVWNRWNHPRRCATRLDRRRKLPMPWDSIPWEDVTRKALAEIGVEDLEVRGPFRRFPERDVLLGLRESRRRTTMRRDDGHVSLGLRDDWTLLRFFEDGYRADVTAHDVPRGIHLASAIASALWGKTLTYRPARDALTRERLDQLLARITDPDDDAFELLEITAEVPGRWINPVIQISAPGQARIESVVADLRQKYCFAEDSCTVYRVKVGFEGRHRIQLHFPPAGQRELVPTYDDLGRDKDMVTRFERLVARTLGIEIHPKVATGHAEPWKEPPGKPRKLSTALVDSMLGPHLDRPAPWQRAYLADLVAKGVVRTLDHAVFRCGDPALRRRFQLDTTLDCPGLVVMPFGSVSADEPLDQDPAASFECSACGTMWELGTLHPPAFHRIEVQVDPEGTWRFLLELLSRKLSMVQEAEGVASRQRRGEREYVVFAPFAAASWLDSVRGTFETICWITEDDAAARPYGDQAVTLAAVLAQGVSVIARALDRARPVGHRPPGQGVMLPRWRPLPRPPVPLSGMPRIVPLDSDAQPAPPDVGIRLIQPTDDGLFLGGVLFAGRRFDRIHLLFAMLQRITETEGLAPRKRGFHLAAELSELDPAGRIEVHHVHQWVHRARNLIEAAIPAEAGLGERVIEGHRRTGIRLGPDFECRGLDLQTELARFAPRTRETG